MIRLVTSRLRVMFIADCQPLLSSLPPPPPFLQHALYMQYLQVSLKRSISFENSRMEENVFASPLRSDRSFLLPFITSIGFSSLLREDCVTLTGRYGACRASDVP